MTKEEITNKIIIQENKVRSMFINLFKDHFSSITATDYEAKIDLSGFTYNNKNNGLNPIYIELKERSNDYSIQYLDENIYCVSGGTYLEAIKLDYFTELYKSNSEAKIIYFNFFQDGYISYDITNRLKNKTSETLFSFYPKVRKNNYNSEIKTKKMYSLCFNSTDYNDKMLLY